MVLDTGSYNLWVTGAACRGDCDNNSKYDSALSSTYVEDGRVFSQSYEDGSEATGESTYDMDFACIHQGGCTGKRASVT